MDNLLLHGSYFESTLKISNFGYSKSSVLDSMAKTAAVGAPAYTPPELLLLAARSDGSSYDGAAIDVWASGIILYCMLTGKLPFLVRPLLVYVCLRACMCVCSSFAFVQLHLYVCACVSMFSCVCP